MYYPLENHWLGLPAAPIAFIARGEQDHTRVPLTFYLIDPLCIGAALDPSVECSC